MHKSRLGAIVIDCETDDFSDVEAFWSQALGCAAEDSDDAVNQNYVKLVTPDGEVQVLLQKVDHPSRVHIDMESDDVAAEVERLEKHGAIRIAEIKSWVVMEAPTGQQFCVVPVVSTDFGEKANTWP